MQLKILKEGNCSFKEKNIIRHEMCRNLLNQLWEVQINKNKKHITGIAEKCLPNITFKEKIMFHNEGIELFHSPGHTADGISIKKKPSKFRWLFKL